MSELSPLALNLPIDVAGLRRDFVTAGHVRIGSFLQPHCAQELHAHLRDREDWRQLINSGEKLFELDRPTRAAMTPQQCAALDEAVHQGARRGFQYRYESIRLPDGNAAREKEPLHAVTRFLSDGDVRDTLRHIIGADDVAFADGQATAYSPGDFLTGHDDAVAGKRRRAAYILGLTPIWRLEWGGLLLFHPDSRRGLAGVVPSINTLDLLAVPQMHSVSMITPAAAYRRYAITGWLRY